MNRNFGRAQVSTETLLAMGVVLVFFIVIITQVLFINNSADSVNAAYGNTGECLKVAFAISDVYSSGSGTDLNFALDSDINVLGSKRVVQIGQDLCQFLANVNSDSSFGAGSVQISNPDGNVVISSM